MDGRRPPQAPYTDYQYHGRLEPPSTGSISSNSSNASRCYSCCKRCSSTTFSNLGVCALVIIYTVLGAFTFMALEGGGDEDGGAGGSSREYAKISEKVGDIRTQTVEKLWSITEDLNILYKDNWTRLASQEVFKFQESLVHTLKTGLKGGTVSLHHRWSFSSSFLYSLTLITTIGYGSVTPRTTWGKIVTIIYALVGIPLMLMYLSTVGDFLARTFRKLYGKLCGCRLRRDPGVPSSTPHGSVADTYRVRHITSKAHNSIAADGSVKMHDEDMVKIERNPSVVLDCGDGGSPLDSEKRMYGPVHVPISLCLLIIISYICGGALLFNKLENWTFLEGSYFCFTSLGTIGFGDLIPGLNNHGSAPQHSSKSKSSWSSHTDYAQVSVYVSSAYILVGMALIAMCFNLVQDEVVILVRKIVRSVGVLREEENAISS